MIKYLLKEEYKETILHSTNNIVYDIKHSTHDIALEKGHKCVFNVLIRS